MVSFLDMYRKKNTNVESDEKVIEITQRGKNALSAGNVSGIEADLLEVMKNGYPFTLDNLAEATSQKRTYVRTAANSLLKKKFIEIVNG